MTYLQRRVAFLVKELENGNIGLIEDLLPTDAGQQLLEDLQQIQRYSDGTIDLSSCSSLVRSTASSVHALSQMPSVLVCVRQIESNVLKSRAARKSYDIVSQTQHATGQP
jgi:hypothetical protein